MRLKGFILGITSLFVLSFAANATHIVGGSLTYEHLGGSTYRITFKMYRDCDPGNATFPGTLNLSVFEGTNTSSSPDFNIGIPFVQEDVLNPPIDTCAFDPGICVSQAIYSTIVNNLYPGTGGYHLTFEYCCRNHSITNVPVTPGVTGSAYHTYIPDNALFLTNSSALWVNFPPVFVCANQPLNFDHSATDQDGDSLAYGLYHPFEDNGIAWGASPTVAANWPIFGNVLYNAGYDPNSPLEPSAPANTLLIDPVTGLMNFSAGANPVLGQHVVGIQVEEWRNGQLINIVYRDFQFNVINCPPPLIADIGPIDACNGNSIDFDNNTSGGGTTWSWDFGDASPTSSQFEPTHAYAGNGPFNVTLIADPGSNCADTTVRVIEISSSTADFTYTDSTCINDPVSFNDASSTAVNGSINQWSWDFGDGSTSTLPNPSHTYTVGGNYQVQLTVTSTLGCIDSIEYPMFVQDFPTVAVGPDTTACENNPLITLNGSISNASGGLWLGQGGSFTPNASTLNAGYSPSAGEITSDTSVLILSSTGNGFCPAGTDTLVIVYVPGPSVDAGPDVNVCKDTAMIPLNGTVTVAGGGQWTSLSPSPGSFSPANDDLNASYIPSATDTAAGSVTIVLTSTFNGNCIAASDTMVISFFDPPTVDILATDTICTGDPIVLNGNTTTGDGFWETLGSGSFSPNDSSVIASYIPSTGDDAAGTVTLIFYTLNNGGCQQRTDTVDVEIVESPDMSFSFTEVCFGQVTDFTNNSTSPDGISGYEWDFGDTNGSNQPNPSYTFGTEGPQNVTLIAFSNNGCSDTLTQSVDVHYLPDVNFINSTPCLNGGSQFIDSTIVIDTTAVSWDWNFGDNGTDNVQDPLHVYQSPGTYNVTLIVTTGFGCVDSLTMPSTVLPGPTAAFDADNYSVNLFQQVNFTDQSTPANDIVDWYWDFGDGMGTSTDQNTSYSYDSTNTFSVLFVVTDINGCMDSLYKDIVVFMPPVVPSGFTPNGDGQNDILYVLGGPYKELDFLIYNNWGELIFESHDQSVGWDGTYKGIDQPLGVFVYTVRAVTQDDVTHELSGDVTLLR
jgi:gliding motility-associated-like protein